MHSLIKKILLFSLILSLPCCSIYDHFFSTTPEDSISHSDFNWVKDSTEHVIYYYENNSFAQTKIEYIKSKTEEDFASILTLIGEDEYPHEITYFLVDSRERMCELVGSETNACAFPRHNSLYAVYSEKIKAIGEHELNHVIAHNLWGSQGETWLSEGLAVYSDNDWWGNDLHSLCKYISVKNKLLTLDELISSFGSHSPMITYPQAGSFVKFLFENYGCRKIELLWKGNDFENVFMKSVLELENEWNAMLDKIETEELDYRI